MYIRLAFSRFVGAIALVSIAGLNAVPVRAQSRRRPATQNSISTQLPRLPKSTKAMTCKWPARARARRGCRTRRRCMPFIGSVVPGNSWRTRTRSSSFFTSPAIAATTSSAASIG